MISCCLEDLFFNKKVTMINFMLLLLYGQNNSVGNQPTEQRKNPPKNNYPLLKITTI